MNALLETVAWNSLAALVLAFGVLVAGRVWRRPELLHVLWLVVLVKLVTPAVFRLEALPDLRAGKPAPLDAEATAVAVPSIVEAPLAAVVSSSAAIDWSRVGSAVWIGGSAFFLGWMLFQCVRFARTMRGAVAANPVFEKRIAAIASRIGVRPPRVRVLDATVPPMVWGRLGGATLVLPRRLLQRLDSHEMDTLIAHELAHLKRRDPWVRWVELAVTAMLWWNPIVWWVRRRLREAEEQACDRWVLETYPQGRRAYADGIVKTVAFLAGHGRTPQFAAGATGTRPIKERLTMILNPANPQRLRNPLVPALVLALLALPIAPGFADRDDVEDERTRAEMLELEREALELEERLKALHFERIELERRLQETRSQRKRTEVQAQVEALRERGEREQARELEAQLEMRERLYEQERSHEMQMLDRKRAVSDEQTEMLQVMLELEQARRQQDQQAVQTYEKALAEYKQDLSARTREMHDAQRAYEMALAQQKGAMAGEGDAFAEAHRDYERALEERERRQTVQSLKEMEQERRQLVEMGRDDEAERLGRAIRSMKEDLALQESSRDDRMKAQYHVQNKIVEQMAALEMELVEDDGTNSEKIKQQLKVLEKKLKEIEKDMDKQKAKQKAKSGQVH